MRPINKENIFFLSFSVKLFHFIVFQKTNKKNPKWQSSKAYICFVGAGGDAKEIQRQNRITAQIVANYLERRLFPFKRPTHRIPTVDEILPTSDTTKPVMPTIKTARNTVPTNDTDKDPNDDNLSNDYESESDPENLQSVESEHVDSYYKDDNEIDEGRSLGDF